MDKGDEMKKKYGLKMLLFLLTLCLLNGNGHVCASEKIQMEEIEQVLEEMMPQKRVSFQELLTVLLSEDEKLEVELLGNYILDSLFYILRVNKGTISYLLMLVIMGAVMNNFSDVFHNKQVSETGFYIVYMVMMIVCLQSFCEIFEMMQESMERLLTFMRVLSPIYFLSMSVSTGKISSVAFYSLMLLLIYLVELVIVNGVLPAVHVYFLIQVLNFLSPEMYLSKLSELIQMVMNWVIKTLVAGVTGVGILQGMLAPSADLVKRESVTKVVNLFPGIGDALGVAGEMMVNTAVLLKNGIGVAGSIFLIVLCLFPVLNVGILTLIYKGVAALIQPISDKRMVELLSGIGETYQILLKIMFSVLFLFLLAIGVSAGFTS